MNRRAALDAAFLVKQLAGQREPFHASLVSQILGRQSLAEIPVDHSRGLRDALEHAKDCKVRTSTHSLAVLFRHLQA